MRLEYIRYFSVRLTFRQRQEQRLDKKWTFLRRMTSLKRPVVIVLRKDYFFPKEVQILKYNNQVREALELLVAALPYPSTVNVICTRSCFPRWDKDLGCAVSVVDDPTELMQEFTTGRRVKSISTTTHECVFCKPKGIA